MKSKKYILLLGASLMMLPACKPTEKNYREAYDIAIAKKQQTEAELEADGITDADAPTIRIVKGDTLYFKAMPLRVKADDAPLHPYNLVVDQFKMPTNARSSAATIKEKGFEARTLQSSGDKWIVVAGGADSLDETIALVKRFRSKFPHYAYIGFGKPVIVRQ